MWQFPPYWHTPANIISQFSQKSQETQKTQEVQETYRPPVNSLSHSSTKHPLGKGDAPVKPLVSCSETPRNATSVRCCPLRMGSLLSLPCSCMQASPTFLERLPADFAHRAAMEYNCFSVLFCPAFFPWKKPRNKWWLKFRSSSARWCSES